MLTPLQKLPKNVGDLGKLTVAKGLNGCPKCNKSPNLVTLVGWLVGWQVPVLIIFIVCTFCERRVQRRHTLIRNDIAIHHQSSIHKGILMCTERDITLKEQYLPTYKRRIDDSFMKKFYLSHLGIMGLPGIFKRHT